MRRSTLLIGCLLAGIWASGCDWDDDGEGDCYRSGTDVNLTVDADPWSGFGYGRELLVTAVVWNSGDRPAWVFDDCCGIRPLMEITDPQGRVVRSNGCLLDCFGRSGYLTEVPKSGALSFDGMVWDNGQWVEGPNGEYHVRAWFSYRESQEGSLETVQRETTFNWYFR